MNLLRYRIMNFRAIVDTGWIECQPVTAFVGSNESGKTTLFLALMKLMSPNNEFQSTDSVFRSNIGKLSKIVLKDDIPIDRAEELKPNVKTTKFIEVVFQSDDKVSEMLSGLMDIGPIDTIHITKTLGGVYDLPDLYAKYPEELHSKVLEIVLTHLPLFLYFKEVTEISSEINLVELAYKLSGNRKVKSLTPRESLFANLLVYLDIWQSNLIKSIAEIFGDLSLIPEKNVDFTKIFDEIPLFKNRINRGFETLSKEFRKWWGKDEITIDYEVYKKGIRLRFIDLDGNTFYLENRSTGFRRFFALFLSFSVAAKQEFENAILLFDEAGAALHPLTQRKLAYLFRDIGKKTQIMYNTHTSYMLPVTEMDSARIVYKDSFGHVNLTTSMVLFEDKTNQESLFVAQSSLAMHLAEASIIGCWPIVLLNKEDMFYLQIIKDVMIAKGKLNSIYEMLIFSAGENGINTVPELYGGDGYLPAVLLSSDEKSKVIKEKLINGKYKDFADRVYEISDFYKDAVYFEDLIPVNFWNIFVGDYLQSILGKDFKLNHKLPVLSQIEDYAKEHELVLSVKYRAEMARIFKIRVMERYDDTRVPYHNLRLWKKMFKALLKESNSTEPDNAKVSMFKWDDGFSIGNDLIDKEHQQLFEIFEKLNNACLAGSGAAVLKQSLDFLVNYVVQHFKDEEELQIKVGYPDYERHKSLHDNLITTVGILMEKYIKHGSTNAMCSELTGILMKWLLNHVQVEDGKIGRFMRGEFIPADEKPVEITHRLKVIKLFTLSRTDCLDYIEKMRDNSDGKVSVKEKEEESQADILLCQDRAFALMYERDEKIFSFILHVSPLIAEEIAKKHNIRRADYLSEENWYDIMIDQTFLSKKDVYKLLDESYRFTLSENKKIADDKMISAEKELISSFIVKGDKSLELRSEETEKDYLIALSQYKIANASGFTITRKTILDDTLASGDPLIEIVNHSSQPQLASILKYDGRAYAFLYRGHDDDCARMSIMLKEETADKLANIFPEVCRAKFPQGKNWYYIPVESSFLSKEALYKVLDSSREYLAERLKELNHNL